MNSAGGVDGDLLLEHKLAINAPGASAVERMVEHRQRIPVGRAALGCTITHGESGKRSKFFFHLAATHAFERAFADAGFGLRRTARDASEIAPSEREAFVRRDVANHEQDRV